MAEESFLSDEFLLRLTAVGEVDVLVGVPTSGDARSIRHVLNTIQLALLRFFPRDRTAVIVADAGSRDKTAEIARAAFEQDMRELGGPSPLRTMERLVTTCPATEGPGAAVRTLFAATDLLRARAAALISPDVETISPEWLETLLRPVYRGDADLVSPIYQRHQFDGLLVKNLVAPLMASAFRRRIYEPAAHNVGFSGPFACHCLLRLPWHEEPARQTVELSLVTHAIVNGFRICQAHLGPRGRAPQSIGQGLVGTLQQVVGGLFRLMEIHQNYWLGQTGSEPTPVLGTAASLNSQPARINKKLLLQLFRNGTEQIGSVLEGVLRPETLEEVRRVAQLSEQDFCFSDELWARTVYEFACSYHHSVINRDHILQALTPLYRGRMASIFLEDEPAKGGEAAEPRLDQLCREFERLRPHLDEGWRRRS